MFEKLKQRLAQRRTAKPTAQPVKQQPKQEQIQNFLLLKLLQVMCELCKQQQLTSWTYERGGLAPGMVTRLVKDENAVYEITHESKRLHNGSRGYYTIEIYENTPVFQKIYTQTHFVPDGQSNYIQAVFELTANHGAEHVSPATKQLLSELQKIEIKNWDNAPETYAIQYLQSLLPTQTKHK